MAGRIFAGKGLAWGRIFPPCGCLIISPIIIMCTRFGDPSFRHDLCCGRKYEHLWRRITSDGGVTRGTSHRSDTRRIITGSACRALCRAETSCLLTRQLHPTCCRLVCRRSKPRQPTPPASRPKCHPRCFFFSSRCVRESVEFRHLCAGE